MTRRARTAGPTPRPGSTARIPCRTNRHGRCGAPRPSTRPRVGVCWASGRRTGHVCLSDKEFGRCCPVAALDPLFALDASFVSLQIGPAAADRPGGLLGIDGRFGTNAVSEWDWADTASVVRQLDAVVTVDTGVAHLAGSLGVPMWV